MKGFGRYFVERLLPSDVRAGTCLNADGVQMSTTNRNIHLYDSYDDDLF